MWVLFITNVSIIPFTVESQWTESSMACESGPYFKMRDWLPCCREGNGKTLNPPLLPAEAHCALINSYLILIESCFKTEGSRSHRGWSLVACSRDRTRDLPL